MLFRSTKDTGEAAQKFYSDDTSQNANFDVPHMFMPLREAVGTNENPHTGIPHTKNTGYLVSGGRYFGDPYGDILHICHL